MTVIYKKELRRLLGGVASYASMAIVLLACGLYAGFSNLLMGVADFSYPLIGSFLALIVALPLLCCGLFASERRSGAQKLWYSLSFRPVDIVLGKYFAVLTVFMMTAAVLAVYPLLFTLFGDLSLSTAYFAWFGYVLMGASLLAACTFISAFGRRAWVPFCVGAGTVLVLWLLQRFVTALPVAPVFSFAVILLLLLGVCAWLWMVVGSQKTAIGAAILPVAATVFFIAAPGCYTALLPNILAKLNPFSRYSGFIYGSFDLEGILFYLSFTVFFVFVTVLLLQYRRDDER